LASVDTNKKATALLTACSRKNFGVDVVSSIENKKPAIENSRLPGYWLYDNIKKGIRYRLQLLAFF
jgi:hypothetical protein